MVKTPPTPWPGDLLHTWWEGKKPRSRGIALMSSAWVDRRDQVESLLALHADNKRIKENHFYLDGKGWASAQAKGRPGVPLHHLILIKREYEDKVVLEQLATQPALDFLTKENNAHRYAPGDPDQYGVLRESRCEPFFDATARGKGREKILQGLMQGKGLRATRLNARLSPRQTQFCLRLHLDGGADRIRVIKGYEVQDDILALLHLEKREKPAVASRRMIDLIGVYDRHGAEVELLKCSRERHVQFFVAFARGLQGPDQVRAYSEGTPLDFFEDCHRIKAKELFSAQ